MIEVLFYHFWQRNHPGEQDAPLVRRPVGHTSQHGHNYYGPAVDYGLWNLHGAGRTMYPILSE